MLLDNMNDNNLCILACRVLFREEFSVIRRYVVDEYRERFLSSQK